jgi:hypothetical protein
MKTNSFIYSFLATWQCEVIVLSQSAPGSFERKRKDSYKYLCGYLEGWEDAQPEISWDIYERARGFINLLQDCSPEEVSLWADSLLAEIVVSLPQ